uniref:Sodium/calcium exchanger membrane region domain-containing protein n=1 Tax=Fagus sylvatica TaxID=28930 RepID=A0A2N9GHG9_FAGSY
MSNNVTFSIFLFFLILCSPTYGRFITHRPLSSSSSSPYNLISDGVHDPLFTESSTCEQTYGFLPCTTTVMGNIFLIAVYGYFMFLAASYLSHGSELLLEILGPGIVGGLFLPILGTLPDAMLILVSGISGTTETAQSQVSIGMGLLAGSTVILLTLIWGSCVIVGKCDLVDTVAQDATDTKGFSLTESGVSTDIWTSYTARLMVISVIPYLIVQIPQLLNSTSGRHLTLLIGLIVSLLLLVSYCLYQVFQPWIQRRKLDYVKHKHVIVGLLRHLREHALGKLVRDDGEPDKEIIEKWLNKDKEALLLVIAGCSHNDFDNFHKNSKRTYIKAVLLLLLGTIIAAALADPLVDAVDDFSDATSIPAFFISFIVLPLFTSSSDAVSAIIFASRNKRRTASLTFSELYGSVTMNNVLSLSVFLALIYFRGLTWDFSSEVLVILIVCIVMGVFASFRTHFPLWTSIVAFLLYPFSLALIYFLDYVLGWS